VQAAAYGVNLRCSFPSGQAAQAHGVSYTIADYEETFGLCSQYGEENEQTCQLRTNRHNRPDWHLRLGVETVARGFSPWDSDQEAMVDVPGVEPGAGRSFAGSQAAEPAAMTCHGGEFT